MLLADHHMAEQRHSASQPVWNDSIRSRIRHDKHVLGPTINVNLPVVARRILRDRDTPGTEYMLVMSDAGPYVTGGSSSLIRVANGSSGCMNSTSPRAGGISGSGSRLCPRRLRRYSKTRMICLLVGRCLDCSRPKRTLLRPTSKQIIRVFEYRRNRRGHSRRRGVPRAPSYSPLLLSPTTRAAV
jgi:hypothetical protein